MLVHLPYASSAVAAVCSTDERNRSSASHTECSASNPALAPTTPLLSSASWGICCSVRAIQESTSPIVARSCAAASSSGAR